MSTLLELPKVAFYFIRHGESDGNVMKLCQGQLDYPLTVAGREQALSAAQRLLSSNIKTMYHSPLIRAAETARIISEVLDLETVVALATLKERSWGVLEGQANPPMFAQEERERAADYDDSLDTAFESKSAFLIRISDAMNEILAVKNHPVAIVGHGRFFNMLCQLMGVEPIKQISNAMPILCQPVAGNWVIEVV